ncbi:MAG: metallophosphatase [Chitinophagaceae bacterium]|nr:metallophosphatase [Chitinophagaceae bacterium]
MLNSRRKFIKQSALATVSFAVPTILTAKTKIDKSNSLTILHTNDVHSRLEPFPMDGSPSEGLGGIAARATVIEQIRNQEEHVLLLDAGDMFQGTPYFNVFKGEPEIRAMSLLGYDAGTIGNHDFDGGLNNLAHQLQHANFPILNCNYNFSNTQMNKKTLPFKIFEKGNIRVGILGVGIELQGLVPESLYGSTQYEEPITKANEIAAYLRKEGCDLIICLSHLGDRYHDTTVSDETLAKQSFDIDLIIGGHTHRLFQQPRKYINKTNSEVLVNQVGWAGMYLGRLDYIIHHKNRKKMSKAHTVVLSKKTN